MKAKSYISFILASFIATQSLILADVAPTPKQIDGYFTRLKRGIKCYWQKKPCDKKDQKAVYQATAALMTLLTITSIIAIRPPRISLEKQIMDAVNTYNPETVEKTINTIQQGNTRPNYEEIALLLLYKIRSVQDQIREHVFEEKDNITRYIEANENKPEVQKLRQQETALIAITKKIIATPYFNSEKQIKRKNRIYSVGKEAHQLLQPGLVDQLGL